MSLRIRAFRGLVPAPEYVNEVNCVPYDVISTEEAFTLVEGKPRSLLHVDRAEVDLPKGTDVHSDAVYDTAAKNFKKLQVDGSLVREAAPCLYLYQQVMGAHKQIGLAAVCHVEDYDNDLIKKHEKTRKDKEDDRTRLIDTIGATTGPVFLTYKDSAEIDALAGDVVKGVPLYDFTAPDGVKHTVWRIEDTEKWVAAFGRLPCSYIADGHHRAASAARVARDRRNRNVNHRGDEDYNWFLCVLFPAQQLKILPYNRVVKDLNGRTVEQFLGEVKERFGLREGVSPDSDAPRMVRMYIGGKWYGLECPLDPQADPVSRLDVSVLQDRLLNPILGIDDPRTNQRIEFVGGARGTVELEKKINSGEGAVAFSMYPTTVEQMMAIADAGQIMPPKSTWFEPKLRSGFFVHTLD